MAASHFPCLAEFPPSAAPRFSYIKKENFRVPNTAWLMRGKIGIISEVSWLWNITLFLSETFTFWISTDPDLIEFLADKECLISKKFPVGGYADTSWMAQNRLQPKIWIISLPQLCALHSSSAPAPHKLLWHNPEPGNEQSHSTNPARPECSQSPLKLIKLQELKPSLIFCFLCKWVYFFYSC